MTTAPTEAAAMILGSQQEIRRYGELGAWGTRTLLDLFDDAVRARPDALALLDPSNRRSLDGTPPRRLTFSALAEVVDRLASSLLALGVGADDVVMVQLPNVVELVCLYLAVGRVGAIVSPLPVQYRAHELRQVLALAEPRLVVTSARFASAPLLDQILEVVGELAHPPLVVASGDALPPGVRSLDALLAAPRDGDRLGAHRAAHPPSANDAFTLCWTSGTEAEPKGVPRSHNHWIHIGRASVEACGLERGAALLSPFPLVNMSGIGGMLVPWLLVGGKLVLHHPLSLPVFLSQIAAERVAYTVVPPPLLSLLVLQPQHLASADVSSLRAVGSGSAPLTPWIVRQLEVQHGIAVVNLFGSNEGVALASGPRDIPDPAERAELFPRPGASARPRDRSATPTSVARATEREAARRSLGMGLEVRLVDPATGALIEEPGVAGELRVRGPSIFAGYWRRPELTRRAFDEDGFFRSGDLFAIALGPDGAPDRLRFVGRLKDVVVRGGTKISSEEVEALLATHPAVAEAAVVGYPDAVLGERLCAVVVPRGGQVIDLDALCAFLREREVALYKLPERLLLVEALPRNAVGKVLKRVLRERLRAPTGPLER